MKQTVDFIYIQEFLDSLLRSSIKQKYGLSINSKLVDTPRYNFYGDYSSNIAFSLAKQFKKSPEKIADELVELLNSHPPLLEFEPIYIASSYQNFINFKLSFKFKLWLIKKLFTPFGLDKVLIQDKSLSKQKIVIEYASPNPNKAMHLGHFRNIVVATPLIEIFKLLGAKVYTDMVLNDKGISISKAMVGYLAYGTKKMQFKLNKNIPLSELLDINKWYFAQEQWLYPQDISMDSGIFVDKFYVLGSNLVKENKLAEDVAQKFVKDWEIQKPEVVSLWELIIGWAVASQQKLFKRLNVDFDTVWRESEHYLLGKKIINRALQRKLLKVDKKDKKGAIIADLTNQNLGKFVLLRSDGTSLYSTQDIALSKLKIERYKANAYYWVVGAEQSYYFKQLFATLKLLGISKKEKLTHIGYALLLTGGKKASSRSGDAQNLIEFLANIETFIKKEYNVSSRKAQILADFIARVAVAKVGATRDYNFDIKQASTIKGHTGAYIMYSYVRAKQILDKYEKLVYFPEWLTRPRQYIVNLVTDANASESFVEKDLDLVNVVAKFPYYLKKTIELLDPAIITNYAFEVADVFNNYYEYVPVLQSVGEIKEFRIYLVYVVKLILENIIKILGGRPIDKM